MFSTGHLRSGLLDGVSGLQGLKPGTARLDAALADKLDKDTRAYLAICYPKPSAAWTKALDTFIKALKRSGQWGYFDRLWVFNTDYRQNARISIVNPAAMAITEVNNPVWTKGMGYNGNGTSSYLNTNYNPATNGKNYKYNSASIGIHANNVTAGSYIDMGFATAYYFTLMYINLGSLGDGFEINTTNMQAHTAAKATPGLYSAQTIDSSHQYMYYNGVQYLTYNAGGASIPSENLWICCYNYNGTPEYSTPRQYAMAFIGGAGMDMAAFYNAWKTFLNNL